MNELNDKDRAFADGARRALRRSEQALDGDSAARLRAARARAVDAMAARPSPWTWMMPAGAVAAALMLFALMPLRAPVPATPTLAADEMLELMGDDRTAGLVQDLDLYVWLEFDRPPA